MFVSLGGWWPSYRYRRYYWYGCHPYRWYGYYPVAREVVGSTYNYYTYNYYDDPSTETTAYESAVDHTTFADVREKLSQEDEEPDEMTLADQYFADAVKAFEAGDYELATKLFAEAMELAPDDTVLPFAYGQALFAAEKYTEAAEILRAALAQVSPEKEGVFYPRGLYTKDDVLFDQLEDLADKAQLYGFDGDLQLLLGYHLLGIGQFDDAAEPLRLASEDLENASSAAVLLGLLEKTRAANAEDSNPAGGLAEQDQ
jgi:tetratricopeptide (TPR) repeat protein